MLILKIIPWSDRQPNMYFCVIILPKLVTLYIADFNENVQCNDDYSMLVTIESIATVSIKIL